METRPLEGKIALVAGATRGAGRGIACGLGEAGATVYCTGRSVKGKPATKGRPETIEETAEMVTARGGRGVFARVDHTREAEVKALFERVSEESGRLDILVNDVWGGDELAQWGKKFWEQDLAKGFLMLERAVQAHIITSRYGVPLMVKHGSGLVIEITDGAANYYRGSLFYDLAKVGAMRLAFDMHLDLLDHDVTALAVTPGFLRSEAVLEHFGVTEDNWRDAVAKDPPFAESETPFYVGRAIAALASDPNVHEKAGRTFATWTLAREYGIEDVDGRQPDFPGHVYGTIARAMATAFEQLPKQPSREDVKTAVRKELDAVELGMLLGMRYQTIFDRMLELGPAPSDEALLAFVRRAFDFG